jgi:hypothetical protein
MPIVSGAIATKGRQVLINDSAVQALTTLQFWINPVSGPKIARRLGYVQVVAYVPSLDISIEVLGTSVWYNAVRLAFPSENFDPSSHFQVVFWSAITSGNWTAQYL